MTTELKVMVGVPGSGKSTWIEQEVAQLEDDHRTTCVVSRDFVRKSLLNDRDGYFDKETEVFNEFVRQINEAMELGIDVVFADATHISPASRAKLLGRLAADPHTHQTTNFYNEIPFIYHVGVDSHDCYPVHLDTVIEDMEQQAKKCIEML